MLSFLPSAPQHSPSFPSTPQHSPPQHTPANHKPPQASHHFEPPGLPKPAIDQLEIWGGLGKLGEARRGFGKLREAWGSLGKACGGFLGLQGAWGGLGRRHPQCSPALPCTFSKLLYVGPLLLLTYQTFPSAPLIPTMPPYRALIGPLRKKKELRQKQGNVTENQHFPISRVSRIVRFFDFRKQKRR